MKEALTTDPKGTIAALFVAMLLGACANPQGDAVQTPQKTHTLRFWWVSFVQVTEACADHEGVNHADFDVMFLGDAVPEDGWTAYCNDHTTVKKPVFQCPNNQKDCWQ